jgi:hypothetical protein
MTYAEKLLDPRWQKKRLDILNRDNFQCKLCFDNSTTLHIHHLKYHGDPWEAYDHDLITYCKHCHSVVEYNKRSEIVPLNMIKRQQDSGEVQLYFIYEDEMQGIAVDIYWYKNDKVEKRCSVREDDLYWVKEYVFIKAEAPV